jgi:Fur family transcriptional regulator, ferric uptake regulator
MRSWSELVSERLAAEGHRAGGAREAVVELLGEQHCCLSAREIADRLRSRRVGIASVYRALDLLHGMGLLARIDVGEGSYRYEPVIPGGEHHHHAVCESCGRVTAFEDARLEEVVKRLGRRLGHRVSSHDITIRGACPRCAKA